MGPTAFQSSVIKERHYKKSKKLKPERSWRSKNSQWANKYVDYQVADQAKIIANGPEVRGKRRAQTVQKI